MKRKTFGWVKYALVLFLFAIAGCHKIDWDDVWHKHNPDCRVHSIRYRAEFTSDSITALFSYNHKGQPTKVVYSFVGTGRPNIVFRYDHAGRLTDQIQPYDNENYELWFRYKHDHKGRIVSDTQYVFGSFIDSVPSTTSFIKVPGFYEYDHWDRISKITRHWPANTIIEHEYNYNGDGNLSSISETTNGSPSGTQTFTTYDDKVNIFRTNKVWMFVGANYSKNNMIAAETYNSKDLPTKFNAPGFNTFRFLHETYLGKSRIEYQCK